jgi:hypothetical protein
VSRLARAALVGLLAGLACGAVALGASAWATLRVDCEARAAAECTFEHELAGQVARLQGLGALGLGLVAAGLAVGLRRR